MDLETNKNNSEPIDIINHEYRAELTNLLKIEDNLKKVK